MTDLLLRLFVKNYRKTDDEKVRTDYTVLGSISGIVVQLLLFVVKLVIGLLVNSLTIISDSFNGFTDSASSLFSLIGAKLAGKPASANHPFGYGRIEYITSVVISVMILIFGGSILYSAIGRMIKPEEMEFSVSALVIMLIAIVVRLTLGALHRSLGKRINSSILLAEAQDAKGDAIVTSLSVVSMLVYEFTGLQVDAYLGALVSIYIIIIGWKLIKATLSPLIGEAATKKALGDVVSVISTYPDIKGSHELIVHEYGPTLKMASIHLEMPVELSFEYAHEVADNVEQQVLRQCGIHLVTHMEPITADSQELIVLRDIVAKIVMYHEPKAVIHDLRMMKGMRQSFCVFDLELPFGYAAERMTELKLNIMVDVEEEGEDIICAIRMINSYVED